MARPEVSGKKLAPCEPVFGAYTIKTFCLTHGLSEAMYHKMKAAGQGPAEMDVGRRRTISVEAAAIWRRKREAIARKSQENKETKKIAEIAS
jgi:hypothetical protein